MDDHGCEGYEPVVEAVRRSSEPMPWEARAALRKRLLSSLEPAAVPFRLRVLRPAFAFATAGVLLGGVSYAAAASEPGHALFGLKKSIVSAVATAQTVLSERLGSKAAHGPAVLRPMEAPAPRSVGPVFVPELRHAEPNADSSTQPRPGQGRSNGRGDQKSAPAKGGERGKGPGGGAGQGWTAPSRNGYRSSHR
jgi:hypothetical protein